MKREETALEQFADSLKIPFDDVFQEYADSLKLEFDIDEIGATMTQARRRRHQQLQQDLNRIDIESHRQGRA